MREIDQVIPYSTMFAYFQVSPLVCNLARSLILPASIYDDGRHGEERKGGLNLCNAAIKSLKITYSYADLDLSQSREREILLKTAAWMRNIM